MTAAAPQQSGTKRPVPVDRERAFASDELFFSTTDPKGIILTGNDVFVRVSGYSTEELVGSPHNIIRHPDMPRCVFRLLWDYLGQGKTIAAYVKNMAKDGAFYWVVAVVSPIPEGYLSIRFKPRGPFFQVAQQVYPALLQVEAAAEAAGRSRKEAMEESTAKLLEVLSANGFAGYDEFMWEAMAQEFKVRGTAAHAGPGSALETTGVGAVLGNCARIEEILGRLFATVEGLQGLTGTIQSESRFVGDVARCIRLLCMNALAEAERLDTAGATLSVVSGAMDRYAKEIAEALPRLVSSSELLLPLTKSAIFESFMSQLRIEMVEFFCRELLNDDKGGQTGARRDLETLVQHSLASQIRHALSVLQQIIQRLPALEGCVGSFEDSIRNLGFVHISGRVEASRLNGPHNFDHIFAEVATRAEEARVRLARFHKDLLSAARALKRVSVDEREINTALADVSGLLGQL